MLPLFVALLLIGSPASYGEEKTGSALQLGRETVLRSAPADDASALGKLPADTIMSSKGEKKGKFILVEVELENDEVMEGWVEIAAIKDNEKQDADDRKTVEVKPKRRMKKLNIPKDELLVIQRDPSFFYGVQLGANYTFMTSATNLYSNPGFTAGAEGGIFLTHDFPLRFEVNYTLLDGVAPTDTANLNFGFLDIAVIPTIIFSPFEVFAGVQYSLGIGMNDLPAGISIVPSQLSGPWVLGGAGYRMSLGYFSDLVFRLKYSMSIQNTYFLFQSITASVALEFRG